MAEIVIYTPDSKKLQSLIERAISDKEIKEGSQKADLTDDILKNYIITRIDSILEVATKEIATFNQLVRILSDKKSLAESFFYEAKDRFEVYKITTLIGMFFSIITIAETFGSVNLILEQYKNINLYFLIILFGFFFVLGRSFYKFYKYYNNSLHELNIKVQLAEEDADKAILEKGLLPELRTYINKRTAEDYSKSISYLSAPGLSEIFDPQYEIPTKAKERVQLLLDNMPGGSIGIAGPRGSGKTTLMWSICKGSLIKGKGFPLLSIMTPAPIEYDTREFILHIFSLICLQLISLNDKANRSFWDYMDSLKTPEIKYPILSSNVARIAMVLFSFFGTILILAGSYITNAILMNSTQKQYINDLDAKPLPFFTIGIVLLSVSLFIYLIPRSAENHKKKLDQNQLENNDNLLLVEARRWLQRIKFQQSYSSGWTGSLKLPVLVEGGINSAISFAEIQSSLPEIVEGFRDFLKNASKQYLVIIGIDELDKLRSNEEAQRFLNDIKALFGIQNVFYLISVSENALSNFERRGLPLRDSFDSSFDKIIYVGYLNLKGAKQLIKRRVIGMPIPFICLCYCLSGGLARDLIRICRDMLEQVQSEDSKVPKKDNSLSTVCATLIKSNLELKLQAISLAAKEISIEPEITNFFKNVYKIQESLNHGSINWELCDLSDFQKYSISRGESEKNIEERRKLEVLKTEMSNYIYYVQTIIEFFNENLSIDMIKNADISGDIDRLAKAYQYLSINPGISQKIITDFRQKYGLKSKNYKPLSNKKIDNISLAVASNY
jgi:hypothetical protein